MDNLIQYIIFVGAVREVSLIER